MQQSFYKLPTGYSFGTVDSLGLAKITVSNAPVLFLYQIAYDAGKTYFGLNRIQVKVADTTMLRPGLKGQAYTNWKKEGMPSATKSPRRSQSRTE